MKTLMALLAALMLTGPGMATLAQAQGYAPRAGDLLGIEVIEDPSLNRKVLVAPDGRISLPLAGQVQATGRSLDAISASIAGALAPNFAARPTVFVSLEALAAKVEPKETAAETISVYVLGDAAKPGLLPLEPGSTVLQAFAQMGGFGKFAATKRVQLRRGADTWVLNYRQIEDGTSTAGSMVLQDGDVIVVPQRRLFE